MREGRNMIRVTILTFLMVVMLSSQSFGEIAWKTDLDSALSEAKGSGKLVMADFYTDWCGWCKKLDKDTYSDTSVEEIASQFVCVKVNGDTHRDLAARYRVRGYPMIIFLDQDGKVVDTIIGYLGPQDMLRRMQALVKKAPVVKADLKNPQKTLAKTGGKFRLGGIAAGPKGFKAIINDKVVVAGGVVDGAKVIEIKSSSVKLNDRGNEVTLEM